MTKIVLTSTYYGSDNLDTLRRAFPDAAFVTAADVATQARELADADAAIGWPKREAVLEAANLRWIHLNFAGIEGIRNLPEVIERDKITVTNARGAHGVPIADSFFAFVLALTRNIPGLLEAKRAHRWDNQGHRQGLRELAGSTLGIIGLGRIGTEIAKRGLGFDMSIRGIDLNLNAKCPGVQEVWGLDRLDDLLRTVDYLAIAIPITAQTEGLIGARELALMKPEAMLFVMSRGGIVDQDALADALKNGRLAGAGLDATRPEPLPPEHPLWDLPNVIISPHTSQASQATSTRIHEILHENLRRFLAGEPLVNVCDKKAGF